MLIFVGITEKIPNNFIISVYGQIVRIVKMNFGLQYDLIMIILWTLI